MMRIRLDIAYDGTDFIGWATQPGQRSVQRTLEDALARVLGGKIRLVVAGRTDSGVHASGQVAHIDLDEGQQARLFRERRDDFQGPLLGLRHRVRGVLGRYRDVDISDISVAPEGFDARFSAVWRRYTYRMADDATPYDPFTRTATTKRRGFHDLDAMNDAASRLVGLHDFAAYCKPRERATTIRTLLEFRWERDSAGVLVAHLKADAFCHSMVRALVGACAHVGIGKLEPADVERLRDEATRTSDFVVFASRGLSLAEVGYPAAELMGLRAEQTRARRTLASALGE